MLDAAGIDENAAPGDNRSQSTVAEAVLTLLEVRAWTLTVSNDTLQAETGQEMTDNEIKEAWNTNLQTMFREEMDDHEADDQYLSNRKRLKANHSRFKVWLFLRFGPAEAIRNVLRHGCPRSVIQRLQDLCQPF